MKKKRLFLLVIPFLMTGCTLLEKLGIAPPKSNIINDQTNQEKVITSILRVEGPSSIEQGDTPNLSDFTLVVSYSDGTTGTITPESIDLDTSSCGDGIIGTITIAGFSTTFSINVVEKINGFSGNFYYSSLEKISEDYIKVKYSDYEDETKFINVSCKGELLTTEYVTDIFKDGTSYIISNDLDSPLNGVDDIYF